MNQLISEAEVQQRVNSNVVVQDGIMNALDIYGNANFVREDEYINGIIADFTLVSDGIIKAIIECKAGNINVTDYVRGIGQLFQYEYFMEQKIAHKSFEYSDDFATIYFFPSSVLKTNTFNVGRFKYPETTMILELNETNNAVRKITHKELREMKEAEDDNLVTISQYYFRDNRLFEYYILLKYLLFIDQMGYERCDRTSVENGFLKKIQTINNGNWRNAFITLSNLGLIDNNNMPTEAGKALALYSYEKYAVNMYYSYLEPYFKEIYMCFNEKEQIIVSNQEIADVIRRHHNDRDVLYMTQSEGRYVSSWLNIMRDDFGVIDFQPRNKTRTLIYNPDELNETTFEKRVKENSIAYKYIDRYLSLIGNCETH